MPNEKQKYVLTARHQLIDLNKNFKNFKLQFQVLSAEPNKDFHAIVLNQEQLDSATDLNTIEMKLAKGKIGGTIVADNDKYQNYFLVLKSTPSNENLEVEVSTSIEEIEPKPQPSEPAVPAVPEPLESGSAPSSELTKQTETATPSPGTVATSTKSRVPLWKNPWVWILFLALLGAGCYYYFYVYRPAQLSKISGLPVETLTPPTVLDKVLPDLAGVETIAPLVSPDTALPTGVQNTGAPVTKSRRGSSKQQLYKELSEIA